MLCLSRKSEQSIMIGDDVEVKILEVRGQSVRLGIMAPSDTTVHRREVWLEIQKEKEGERSADTDQAD